MAIQGVRLELGQHVAAGGVGRAGGHVGVLGRERCGEQSGNSRCCPYKPG